MSDEIKKDKDATMDGTYSNDVVEEESDDSEEYVEGKSLIGQQYETPSDADKFIDTQKGEVVDKTKLSDFDVIKAVAKQNNIEIRKPRSGCKRCYGRGFIGRDFTTKQPIPCTCIQILKSPSQKESEHMYDSSKQKPQMNKKMIKMIKKLMKSEKKKINEQNLNENKRLEDIEHNVETTEE